MKNTAAVLATAQIAILPFGVYGSLASILGVPGATAAVTGYSRIHEAESDLLLVNAAADMAMGRFSSGRKCLDKYVSLNPACPKGHFHLGEYYRQRAEENDADRALEAYAAAVRYDPDHAGAYKGMGLVHYKQNRREKAREAFETYLMLKPDAEDAAYIRHYLRQLDRK